MPKGAKTGFLKSEVADTEPVVKITESVHPRLIAVIDDTNGDNVMVVLSYDREKKACRLQARWRDKDGVKIVPKPSTWCSVKDWKALDAEATLVRKKIKELFGDETHTARFLEIPTDASIEHTIKLMSESGLFDVVKLDPDTNTATKEA